MLCSSKSASILCLLPSYPATTRRKRDGCLSLTKISLTESEALTSCVHSELLIHCVIAHWQVNLHDSHIPVSKTRRRYHTTSTFPCLPHCTAWTLSILSVSATFPSIEDRHSLSIRTTKVRSAKTTSSTMAGESRGSWHARRPSMARGRDARERHADSGIVGEELPAPAYQGVRVSVDGMFTSSHGPD